ncbi:MAG TPA: LLM class flavin-dependent oxidoreductase [Actinomycetota bacterium]|nr:LLM class flavin-dependent oxidoreductase [Actinomycetota bacterium]
MRFGLALPHYGFSFPEGGPLDWGRLVDHARRAEALGFDSVWISDHFFLDLARYGGPPEPHAAAEPFTALAGIAVATRRVRLGTLVACTGFRHPAHVVKMATTLDLLSEGRMELGLGAGWYEREFRAFGYPFGTAGERFDRLEEFLAVARALFGEGEPVDHEGRHFRLHRAYNHPRPAAAGRPPIWVGSKGKPRSARLAARYADGWNTVWRWAPQDYRAAARAMDAACEAEGRDPATLRRSLGLHTLVGENDRDLRARYEALRSWTPGRSLDPEPLESFAAGNLVGTVDAVREQVAAWEARGVEELIVSLASLPFAVADGSLADLFAEGVIHAA